MEDVSPGDLSKKRQWPEGALDMSEDDLYRSLREFNLVVVDCWVSWCKHSKRMMPIFESLARELSGKAVFGKIDALENFHVPVKFKVKATPTFLIFKNGQLVEKVIGEMTKEELDHSVRRHLDLISAAPLD